MQPLYQILTGAVNGANLVFSFGVAYTPGTVAILRNGQVLIHGGGNPWIESNPATGEITLDVSATPQVGDQIVGWALDTSVPGPETVIDDVLGTLADGSFIGLLVAEDTLAGVIEGGAISGSIVDSSLVGTIADDQISGTIEVC